MVNNKLQWIEVLDFLKNLRKFYPVLYRTFLYIKLNISNDSNGFNGSQCQTKIGSEDLSSYV